MRTWKELEQDFRALHQHADAELEHLTSAAGEDWSVRGNSPRDVSRFESLAAIAGAKVLDLQASVDWPEVVDERDAKTRWYRCLKRFSSDYKPDAWVATGPATDTEPKGARTSLGRISRVFAASSVVCVAMESFGVAPRLRLEALCAVPRYAGPCQQWTAAQRFLSAPEPDLAQAVAEASSAVEGMARVVLGTSKTLGDAAQELRQKRGLHPALSLILDKVYGYASDVGGIRHGATTVIQVKPAEARFAIDICEAALLLLLALDAGG
ncbi:MAG TPA: hypothetical protein VGN09_23190 [Vicinamibacteria bacterium]|jgi:hypothetical protein